MTRRCVLCGDPCHGAYCHTHEWAAGTPIPHEQAFQNASTGGIEITDLHEYWMTLYNPEQVTELAAYLEAV